MLKLSKNLIIIFLLLSFYKCHEQSESAMSHQNSIYTATESNFEKLRDSTRYLVVEFYYNDCNYCQDFAPIYSKLAKELAEKHHDDIKFAIVDVTLYPKLSTRFKVSQFPTIILLGKGDLKERDYNGDLNYNDFKKWLLKKTFESVFPITSQAQLQSFILTQKQNNKAALVFFKDDDRMMQETTYLQVSKEEDNFDFGVCSYPACAVEQSAKLGSMNVYQPNGDVSKYEDEFEFVTLGNWVIKNAFPLVLPFGYETSELLFSKFKPAVFLYRLGKDAGKYDGVFSEVSKKVRQSFNVL